MNLFPGFVPGDPNVAEQVVIKLREGAALAKEGLQQQDPLQEPNGAGVAGGVVGKNAEHGRAFHFLW